MKKTALIILTTLVFLGGLFIFYQNRPAERKMPTADQIDQQTNAKQKWESKTDDQSAVIVIVTPIDIFSQAKEWKFDIVMDTHSVEMDQDFTKTAVLVDGQRKEYKPLRWEGTPAGGHHREGTLVFGQIKSDSNLIELKISGIGDATRSFSWQIK